MDDDQVKRQLFAIYSKLRAYERRRSATKLNRDDLNRKSLERLDDLVAYYINGTRLSSGIISEYKGRAQ